MATFLYTLNFCSTSKIAQFAQSAVLCRNSEPGRMRWFGHIESERYANWVEHWYKTENNGTTVAKVHQRNGWQYCVKNKYD